MIKPRGQPMATPQAKSSLLPVWQIQFYRRQHVCSFMLPMTAFHYKAVLAAARNTLEPAKPEILTIWSFIFLKTDR